MYQDNRNEPRKYDFDRKITFEAEKFKQLSEQLKIPSIKKRNFQ